MSGHGEKKDDVNANVLAEVVPRLALCDDRLKNFLLSPQKVCMQPSEKRCVGDCVLREMSQTLDESWG